MRVWHTFTVNEIDGERQGKELEDTGEGVILLDNLNILIGV